MAHPHGAPVSELFEIRCTPNSGRAVFASHDIPADTAILASHDLAITVLLREYRKEVCAYCFSYDYGNGLKLRESSIGFAFCSADCQQKWREDAGEVGLAAWTAVEDLTKSRSKEDAEMQDGDDPRPTAKQITQAWEQVAKQAALIRLARQGSNSKRHRKSMQAALAAPISPDVMVFCVSGILFRYAKPNAWPSVLALATDSRPYHNTRDLVAFTRSYLQLLAILPEPLLKFTTPEILFVLSSRDSHNSFGIRSLEDEGSEFFGYGCWPGASYFNHSCGPNLTKNRVGRVWKFTTAQDIEKGEELCISYLSVEERKLSRGRRMERLTKTWGFECKCKRCEGVI
ncbi:SET domain-containing protein [Lepidopterella palustris CBS 459.81]|uniref:SET domain-containing protein n=1 Tax=Lepidopterella palustris CBS 459.81 TaxID=1314670 RepID=A0A8E2JI11_9PEZI|nr:SET domain-containing protein [Lepidopterella palustris CBS 459.81]